MEEAATCFNPRAPGGARLTSDAIYNSTVEFQSTRPGRSATRNYEQSLIRVAVSIHAPRAERDNTPEIARAIGAGFNPRAPGGARQALMGKIDEQLGFNPRAPGGARPTCLVIR